MTDHTINQISEITRIDRRTLRKRLANVTPNRVVGRAKYFTMEQAQRAFEGETKFTDKLPANEFERVVAEQIYAAALMCQGHLFFHRAMRRCAEIVGRAIENPKEHDLPLPGDPKHLKAMVDSWAVFMDKACPSISEIAGVMMRLGKAWDVKSHKPAPLTTAADLCEFAGE